jgi:hypothetical protein
MLKSRMVVFGLVLGMGLFATQTQAETESVSFTLVNRTSRNLQEFYASPPEVEDWEEDILGSEVLPPGESMTIVINDGREDCLYDFMGVLGPNAEGTVGEGALIQSGVSVCDGDTYEYFED